MHEDFKKMLEILAKKGEYIAAKTCPPAPVGCGKPWGEFRNKISRGEANISALCQGCQDKVFGACDCTDQVPCLEHVHRISEDLLNTPEARAAELRNIQEDVDMAGPEDDQ